MTCIDCDEDLKPNRRRAVMAHGLAPRCIPCQLGFEKQSPMQMRPADVAGLAVGADYDSTREHFEQRQGIL